MSWKIKENIFLSIIIIFFLLIGIKASAVLQGWCPYPYYIYHTPNTGSPGNCWTYAQCGTPCRTKYQCGPAGNLLDLRKYDDLTRADFESWGCWERDIPSEREGDSCRQCKSDVPTADCHEKICMVPDSEETAICDQSVVDCVSIPTMTQTNPANLDNENEIPHYDERPVATKQLFRLGLPNVLYSRPATTSYWQNEQERRSRYWKPGDAYICDTAEDCCYDGFPYTMSYYPQALPVNNIKYRVDNNITAPLWHVVPSDIDSWEEFDQFITEYGEICYYFGGNKREDRCVSGVQITPDQDFAFVYANPKEYLGFFSVSCPSSLIDPVQYHINPCFGRCPDMAPAGATVVRNSSEIPSSNGNHLFYKWTSINYVNCRTCSTWDMWNGPKYNSGVGIYPESPLKVQASISSRYNINITLPEGGNVIIREPSDPFHDGMFELQGIFSPSGANTGYGYSDDYDCETENVSFCIEGAQANIFDQRVLQNQIRKCRDYYHPEVYPD